METYIESQSVQIVHSKDAIYNEYAEIMENGENVYSLHFSFQNSTQAKAYLEKVRKW